MRRNLRKLVKWECQFCHYYNRITYSYCKACETPKNAQTITTNLMGNKSQPNVVNLESKAELPEINKNGTNLYSQIRLNSISNNGGNETQLSRVKFYGNIKSAKTINIESVSNPKGHNPYNEGPEKLKKDHGKWLDFNTSSTLIFTFSNPQSIEGYELFTANDFPERDPIVWTLEGKNNQTNEWELLDKQDYFNPPIARNKSYGILQINFGEFVEIEKLTNSTKNKTHFDSGELNLHSSVEMTTIWTYEERDILKEYQEAYNMIGCSKKLMTQTKIQSSLEQLDYLLNIEPLQNNFNDVLSNCIKKAYNLSKKSSAKKQTCKIGGYYLYNSINKIYNSFHWRKKYLHCALRFFFDEESSDSLISILYILARGGEECKARKIMAFNSVIQRVVPESFRKVKEIDEKFNCKNILYEKAYEFLEDRKLKAFSSAFLEPAKFYFDRIGNSVLRDDVEVHGSNVYAALLLSTIGIQLPIMPFLKDEQKGAALFLDAIDGNMMKHFDEKENFGNSWHLISQIKNCRVKNVGTLFMPSSYYVMELANKAIDPSSSNKSNRKMIASYIKRFTNFFTLDSFLEPLCIAFIQDNRKELTEAMNIMKELPEYDTDIRLREATEVTTDWLYNMDEDTFMYSFEPSDAILLCKFIGILE